MDKVCAIGGVIFGSLTAAGFIITIVATLMKAIG